LTAASYTPTACGLNLRPTNWWLWGATKPLEGRMRKAPPAGAWKWYATGVSPELVSIRVWCCCPPGWQAGKLRALLLRATFGENSGLAPEKVLP
jgi:hypothetical protein